MSAVLAGPMTLGLAVASVNGKGATKKDLLKPKQYPNCSESNKPDSEFCTKCKFVLSFDPFDEVTNQSEETKKKCVENECLILGGVKK